MSLRKYSSTASSVPSWMMAVNAAPCSTQHQIAEDADMGAGGDRQILGQRLHQAQHNRFEEIHSPSCSMVGSATSTPTLAPGWNRAGAAMSASEPTMVKRSGDSRSRGRDRRAAAGRKGGTRHGDVPQEQDVQSQGILRMRGTGAAMAGCRPRAGRSACGGRVRLGRGIPGYRAHLPLRSHAEAARAFGVALARMHDAGATYFGSAPDGY